MHELRGEEEPSMEEILERLTSCDLVLVEGYKREGHKKIEARRTGTKDTTPLSDGDPSILAIAADHAVPDSALPIFGLDEIGPIANFIESATGLTGK
jgi:molybdopterin-guanine dinucleotide biosynthesis protein B